MKKLICGKANLSMGKYIVSGKTKTWTWKPASKVWVNTQNTTSMCLEFGSEKYHLLTGMISQVGNHEDESWKNGPVSDSRKKENLGW